MQPSDKVNINWNPSPVQNKDATPKYEATWSNGEKTYTITVGIPKGLSHEYVKNIIEEKFKEFKDHDMDMLAENRYDPLKKDRESKTFSDGKTEITLKRTELTGWITGMLSPKDESDLMIEAVVVPSPQKREDGVEIRSFSLETSPAAGRSSFVSRASPEQAISPSSEFNKALFDRLPDEMIVSMLMKLSVKEIARMREVDTRFRDIGGEALAKKISDENISLAKLGLEGNAKVLAFLDSLSSENRLHIRQLNLLGTEIDNRFLARLSSLTPNLQGLNLEYNQITDDGLKHLATLTELRSLSLAYCRRITDRGLQHLAPLTQLRNLNLRWCDEITNDGLKHLAPFTDLRNLSLAWCSITNDGLQHLATLTQLRGLNLAWCKITDSGLKHLAPFKKLKNLSLAWCSQITNDGLQHLATLTQLRGLSLARCDTITDDGLQHLEPFKKLENLSLQGCNEINGNRLNHLAPLMQLRRLDLGKCDKITDSAKRELMNRIPGLTVLDSGLFEPAYIFSLF